MAFLNSFRVNNPTMPLCLIPFDGNCDKLRSLSDSYAYSIFDDSEMLHRCDAIGSMFFGHPRGHFRKLCAFDGPFSEFIYIDCDTVVVSDVSFVFQYSAQYDFVFSHSNRPGLRQWVWKDSIYESSDLVDDQIDFSANTGFFCSRRGAISIDNAEQDLSSAVALAPHMELGCVEQPYLNYLVVTSGKRYTSLLEIQRRAPLWNIPLEKWAGGGFLSPTKDSVRHKGTNFFLFHWAGSWAAGDFDRKVYRWLARFGIRVRSPSVKIFMPRKRLWRRYRYLKFTNMMRVLDRVGKR